MLDSPLMQAISWTGLPVAAAAFAVLAFMMRDFLRRQAGCRWRPIQIAVICLASAVAVITAIAASFSTDLLYPPSIDEERNLAGMLAVARGQFVPFQGPEVGRHLGALRQVPVYLGPFYYLTSGLFLLVSEGPAASAIQAAFLQVLMILAGSAFLRRTAGTLAVAVWCCLSVTFLAERSSTMTHLYLGMPFTVIGMWALHDTIRTKTEGNLPLIFLAGALAMQFYAANTVWVAVAAAMIVATGIRPSRRTVLLSAGLFLLVHSFTIFTLAVTLFSHADGAGTAPGTAAMASGEALAGAAALVGLAAGLVVAVVVSGLAGRLILRRFSWIRALLETEPGPAAFLLSGLLAVAAFICVFGNWQERFIVFILPAAWATASISTGRLVAKAGLRLSTPLPRVVKPLQAATVFACMFVVFAWPGQDALDSIIEPDEFGQTFATRFDETEFGGPLVDFIQKAGVSDAAGYLEHARSMVDFGNGKAPPVFPLFYIDSDSSRHDATPVTTEFLFLPRTAATCGSGGPPPAGRPEILVTRDYCVVTRPSGSDRNDDGESTWPTRDDNPSSPPDQKVRDRYTWPTMLMAKAGSD